jgi:hypothetical protein
MFLDEIPKLMAYTVENVIYAAAKVNDIVIPRQPLFIPKVNQARFVELGSLFRSRVILFASFLLH